MRINRLLNIGVLAITISVLLVLGQDSSSLADWSLLAVLAALAIFFFIVRNAEISDREAIEEQRRRSGVTGEREDIVAELDQLSRALRNWSRALAAVAFGAAMLILVEACQGTTKEVESLFLSALLWLVLAAAAGNLRREPSPRAALFLLAIPVAQVVAQVASVVFLGRRFDGALWRALPLCILAVTARCSYLVFKYQRRLRLGG